MFPDSTTILNGQYLSWNGSLYYCWDPAQREARNNIEKCCNYFCEDPLRELGPVQFEELVKMKGIDYSGEEISHAVPLRLGELPEREVAGSFDAAAVAVEEVRAWLMDPRQCLLPEDMWPSPLPSASMNVKKEDWRAVAATVGETNILTSIPFEDIVRAGDVPVFNCLFCVTKTGAPKALPT